MNVGRGNANGFARSNNDTLESDRELATLRWRAATTRKMNDMNKGGAAAPLIRVLDADRATLDLLQGWLTSAGFAVAGAEEPRSAVLTILDVPFGRHGGREIVERVSTQYPDTPILALSPTFFSNVECGGNCARALGVAGVLPKPIARDALITAVRRLVQTPAT